MPELTTSGNPPAQTPDRPAYRYPQRRLSRILRAVSGIIVASSLLFGVYGSVALEAAPLQDASTQSVALDVQFGFDGGVQHGHATPVLIQVDVLTRDAMAVVLELETTDSLYRAHIDPEAFVEQQYVWELLIHGDVPWIGVTAYDESGTSLATVEAYASQSNSGLAIGVGESLRPELTDWVAQGGQLLGSPPSSNTFDGPNSDTAPDQGGLHIVDFNEVINHPVQFAATSLLVLDEGNLAALKDEQRVHLTEWIQFGGELSVIVETYDIASVVSLLSPDDDAASTRIDGLPSVDRYRYGMGTVRLIGVDGQVSWMDFLEQPTTAISAGVSNSNNIDLLVELDHDFVGSTQLGTKVLLLGVVGFMVVIGPMVWGLLRLFGRPTFAGASVVILGLGATVALLVSTSAMHGAQSTHPVISMDIVDASTRIEALLPFNTNEYLRTKNHVELFEHAHNAQRFAETSTDQPSTWLTSETDGVTLQSNARVGQPATALIRQQNGVDRNPVAVTIIEDNDNALVVELTNDTRAVLFNVSMSALGHHFAVGELSVGRPHRIVVSKTIAAIDSESAIPTADVVGQGVVRLPSGDVLGASLQPMPRDRSIIVVGGDWFGWDPQELADPSLFASQGNGFLRFRQFSTVVSSVGVQVVSASEQFTTVTLPNSDGHIGGATAERVVADALHATMRLTPPTALLARGDNSLTLECFSTQSVVSVQYFDGSMWVEAELENQESAGALSWTVPVIAGTGAGYIAIDYPNELDAPDPVDLLHHCVVVP